MTKETLYVYLGTNGTIVSPIHLENIYYTNRYRLTADEGKKLTKDDTTYQKSVVIPVDELDLWKEVAGQN
jgi:hypothetical protein